MICYRNNGGAKKLLWNCKQTRQNGRTAYTNWRAQSRFFSNRYKKQTIKLIRTHTHCIIAEQVELQQTSIAQGVEREAEVTQRWKACDAKLQELNDAKFDTEAITAFDRQIQRK